MPSTSPYVCVPCRNVFRLTGKCPDFGEVLVRRHHKWRAPRKTNDKAWKLIEQGDWLWDKRALRGRRDSQRSQEWRDGMLERLRRINPKYGQNVTDRKK